MLKNQYIIKENNFFGKYKFDIIFIIIKIRRTTNCFIFFKTKYLQNDKYYIYYSYFVFNFILFLQERSRPKIKLKTNGILSRKYAKMWYHSRKVENSYPINTATGPLPILPHLLRPVQGYTGTDKIGLTAPPHLTQDSAEGFRHNGQRQIFNTNVRPMQPSTSRFAH